MADNRSDIIHLTVGPSCFLPVRSDGSDDFRELCNTVTKKDKNGPQSTKQKTNFSNNNSSKTVHALLCPRKKSSCSIHHLTRVKNLVDKS